MAGSATSDTGSFRRRMGARIAALDAVRGPKAVALALLPLTLLALFPVGWHPNEEYTYLTAYMGVGTEAVSPYTSVFDETKARFLYHSIIGWAVAFFGYDFVQIAMRVLMALLYAAALGSLFAAIGLSALRALATVSLFYILGQTIFGDDWLFDAAESKTYAYGAVIFALACGLKARWYAAVFLVALATYLHFLVGGFWALALFALMALSRVSWGTGLRAAGAYFLLVAPLIGIVLADQIGNAIELAPGMPDPNVVYALRNAHHIAPFSSTSRTLTWLGGAAEAALLIGLMALIARRAQDRLMPTLCLLLLGYFFVASAVAFADRDSHVFAKFYMFRPFSLILMLTIATAAANLEHWWPKRLDNQRLAAFATIVLIGIGVILGFKVHNHLAFREFPHEAELAAVIERESAPGEIVLVEPKLEKSQPYVGLERRLGRPTLVSYKFVPTNPKDIVRWQDLLAFRQDLFDEGCTGPLPYPVRLVIAFGDEHRRQAETCGTAVWQRDSITVVRVSEDFLANREAPPGRDHDGDED